MSEVVIRRATCEDAAAVAVVQVRSSAWAYAGLLPQHEPIEARVARRTLVWREQLAEDGTRQTFVAERDEVVVGFVTVGPAEDETLAGIGQLFAIYVEPDVVGGGVGRALLERAVAELGARGFGEAVLWVLEENARARRFYERAGWSLDGARNDHVRDGQLRHEIRYRCRV